MFYCETCRQKNDWPISFTTSRGKCECCGEVAVCHDRPSSSLPLTKVLPASPDVITVVGGTAYAASTNPATGAVDTLHAIPANQKDKNGRLVSTAAQPLDLDKLEVLKRLMYRLYCLVDDGKPPAVIEGVVRSFYFAKEWEELIAQARAARLDTVVSDPQEPIRAYTFDAEKGLTEIQTQDAADTTASASEGFNKCKHCDAITHPNNPEEVCPGCQDVLLFRAAQPVQTGVAVDERALFDEMKRLNPNWNANGASRESAVRLALRARATLAPVAAQQAAAVAAPSEPVARLHITLDDDGLSAEVEVLNGEHLQVEDSPVDVYLAATTSEDARDAARYRWLRNSAAGQFEHPIVVSQHHKVGQGMRYMGPVISRELDRLIDAAMRATQQEGGNE